MNRMRDWQQMRRWILAGDLVWMVLALMLARLLDPSRIGLALGAWRPWMPVLLVLGLSWSVLVRVLELDGFRAGWRIATILAQCLLAVLIMMLILVAEANAGLRLGSPAVLRIFAPLFCVGTVLIRFLAARLLAQRAVPTLVLGDGRLAREAARRVHRHPELGWEVLGFLGLEMGATGERAGPALRTPDLVQFVVGGGVRQLIVALEQPPTAEVYKLLEALRAQGIRLLHVPAQFEVYASRAHLLDLDGIPIISFLDSAPPPLALGLKRVGDCALAAALLLITLPLWGPLALAARLRFGGSFERLPRVGRDGVPFAMLRLRWRAVDRSHWLRRSGLRELPQFFNVLRGEMSLVGPRPEPLELAAPHHGAWSKRLALSPGITGLAQVYGLGELDREHDRHSYDLEYIHRWSLSQDLAILFQTVSTLVSRCLQPHDGRGPHPRRSSKPQWNPPSGLDSSC